MGTFRLTDAERARRHGFTVHRENAYGVEIARLVVPRASDFPILRRWRIERGGGIAGNLAHRWIRALNDPGCPRPRGPFKTAASLDAGLETLAREAGR